MLNDYEERKHHKHLICWKSALAGLALAIVSFIGVMTLAAAFGGIALSDGGETVKKMASYAAGFLVVGTVLGAFVGSYFGVRVARIKVELWGASQGLLIGSLLVLVVLCHTFSTVGHIGQAVGQAIGATAMAAGTGAAAAGQNSSVQEIFEDNMQDLKLKSEPSVVIKGVASRVLRGDTESAKNYLAYQASMTPAEADQKIAAAKAKVDEAATKLREATANAMKATGWGLFVLIVLGLSASALGGLLATKCNERATLDTPVMVVKK